MLLKFKCKLIVQFIVIFNRWKCKDERYLIQKGSSGATNNITATCTWYTNFTISPADLTCVLTYCINATNEPLINDLNYLNVRKQNGKDYNFEYRSRIPLEKYIDYECKAGHALVDDVKYRSEAKKEVRVLCKNDGYFDYPNPWQPCVSSVECLDPGIIYSKQ